MKIDSKKCLYAATVILVSFEISLVLQQVGIVLNIIEVKLSYFLPSLLLTFSIFVTAKIIALMVHNHMLHYFTCVWTNNVSWKLTDWSMSSIILSHGLQLRTVRRTIIYLSSDINILYWNWRMSISLLDKNRYQIKKFLT